MIYIKQKVNKKTLIAITVLITILLFVPKVYAKYMDAIILKSNTQIAKPIFIVEGTEISKINSINNVGYYEFYVKNYDENNISEIGFNYVIEVVTELNESIKFELYKGDEQIELKDLKTNEIYIGANEKIEQKYKLKIIYDKNLNSIGKDILQEVQIKVHSEQEEIG